MTSAGESCHLTGVKRFLLFIFDEFYPRGGWNDFVDSFDTLEEAQTRAKARRGDWYHIIDTQTGTEVDGYEQ